ncbi:hypothetical protein BHE74_00030322 [Ensete ventricosum]|nr:hypothetical protein BHE74_00030322 [Ensete ventricosum]
MAEGEGSSGVRRDSAVDYEQEQWRRGRVGKKGLPCGLRSTQWQRPITSSLTEVQEMAVVGERVLETTTKEEAVQEKMWWRREQLAAWLQAVDELIRCRGWKKKRAKVGSEDRWLGGAEG